MKGSHICSKCGRSLASPQSLWNHQQRCKDNKSSCPGKSYSANRKNHEIKSEIFKQLKESDEEKLQTPTRQQKNSVRLDIEEENPILGDDKSVKESGSDVSSDIEEKSILDESEESDVSSAEDEEDENMDKKVWHVILHYSNANECTPLEAFKDFCRWCRALEEDPIVKKVIDSAQVSRDKNTGFKEALNEALNKRKFLIMRALGENRDGIVWKELEGDPDALKSLRRHILFLRAMKRDPTFQSVMKYKKECVDDEDMDSDEALDHSIDEKDTDIIAASQGKGLYLHPYGKGLSEVAPEDIWKKIAREYQPWQHDPYSDVKYFVRVQYLIEQNEIFKTVLEKIQTYMKRNLPFEKALDKSVKEEERLIHRGFASNDELWCMMKDGDEEDEEGGDEEDDLDVFKAYVAYYQNLTHDKTFQAIMNNMKLALDTGMTYKQALSWTISENRVKIKKAMKIPNPWPSKYEEGNVYRL